MSGATIYTPGRNALASTSWYPATIERLSQRLGSSGTSAIAFEAKSIFGDAYRAMYSTDAANYRQLPIAVVLPLDADDAQSAMRVCHAHGVPVTPRGGGSSLTGRAATFR